MALLLTAPLSSGCQRLNPVWCDEHARCPVDEYCDPSTNTCRQLEAGAGPDRGLDLGPDDAVTDPGDEQPTLDLPAVPDQKPADASSKPDLPAGPG